MRPIPYHMPPVPGYLDQALPVFRIVPPQDEALSLSRLAEYFAEMNRPEPASLAANILAQSFPEDPNAVIARATVYAHAKDFKKFERELARLAADVEAGKAPFSWDRRVQRAILLALGRQPELARREIEECLAHASEEVLFELTALQVHRLNMLAKDFDLAFPNPALARLAATLGAEYDAARPAGAE
jgi:hypothetical protein